MGIAVNNQVDLSYLCCGLLCNDLPGNILMVIQKNNS